MESEKIMYWLTLGVLAMATITGFVTGHRGWSDRLAERSISMMSQASETAKRTMPDCGGAVGKQRR